MTGNNNNENMLNWLAVGVSGSCIIFMIYLMYVVVSGKESLW